MLFSIHSAIEVVVQLWSRMRVKRRKIINELGWKGNSGDKGTIKVKLIGEGV